MPDQYVWLVWSSAFLVPWLAAYVAFPRHRKAMMWASLITARISHAGCRTDPSFCGPLRRRFAGAVTSPTGGRTTASPSG